MLIRVRTDVGLWRVEVSDANQATSEDILKAIEITRPNVVYEKVSVLAAILAAWRCAVG